MSKATQITYHTSWKRGIGALERAKGERTAVEALKALDARIQKMETRYQKMMRLLDEEGLFDRPFDRRDASWAFGVDIVKAGQYLTELKELGLIRKARAEGLPRMWVRNDGK